MALPAYAYREPGKPRKPPDKVDRPCRMCARTTWQEDGLCTDCRNMLNNANNPKEDA